MSHVSTHKCDLGVIDQEVFKAALDAAARDLDGNCVFGGQVGDYVGENRQRCDASIVTPNLPHGVGFNFASGGECLSIVGDPYGKKQPWDAAISTVKQYYSTLYSDKALKLLGYSVGDFTKLEDGSLEFIATKVTV